MEDYRKQIEDKIVNTMVEGLKAEKIDEAQSSLIAKFVLEGLEKVNSQDQLIGFLHILALKWPLFSNIALGEEGKLKKNIEAGVTQNVLQLIKNGQFKEAVNLADQII